MTQEKPVTVQQVIDVLQAAAADPMWADHVELSKKLVLHAVTMLQASVQAPAIWTEQSAVDLAHRAGFAGTWWSMGPYELTHMLNLTTAHPPQQHKPISDERLDELWRLPMSADWEHREYARLVEKEHNIGEST